MMATLIGAAALASAAVAQAPLASTGDPCVGQESCVRATAAQLFAAADAMAARGDLAGAELMLQALTQDPHPEHRAEARFRLASVRENRGNLSGAIEALRALLEEKPDAGRARLELSRLLALQGEDRAARRELRAAEASGLPPAVARTVKRFSAALNSRKRRGVSIELAAGTDSNINRSTSDQYIDTVIAPFELDADARGQSGIGISLGGQAFSRDSLLGATLLTRAGARMDFFGKKRFNDIQLSLNAGPELSTSIGRFRPALIHERRWYGGKAYSRGTGFSLNWVTLQRSSSQVELDGSVVRQSVRNNAVLDGYRYAVSAAYDRALTPETSARIVLRASALSAAAKPESVRQGGVDWLVAHNFGFATLYAQGGYTKTSGRAPLALFGTTREDNRVDIGGGIIAHDLKYVGFSPLIRLTHTKSRSNLELYDYRRTRVDFGLAREF